MCPHNVRSQAAINPSIRKLKTTPNLPFGIKAETTPNQTTKTTHSNHETKPKPRIHWKPRFDPHHARLYCWGHSQLPHSLTFYTILLRWKGAKPLPEYNAQCLSTIVVLQSLFQQSSVSLKVHFRIVFVIVTLHCTDQWCMMNDSKSLKVHRQELGMRRKTIFYQNIMLVLAITNMISNDRQVFATVSLFIRLQMNGWHQYYHSGVC